MDALGPTTAVPSREAVLMNARRWFRGLIVERERASEIVIRVARYERCGGGFFQGLGGDDSGSSQRFEFRRILHVGEKSDLAGTGFFDSRDADNLGFRVAGKLAAK